MGERTMAYDVRSEFPSGHDGAAILDRLDRVLDPELDESILQLGFVRSVQLRDGQIVVSLQLPTSWCAMNFAYIMAEDVRRALLGVAGIQGVTVRLGDHCVAQEIEAAVNDGKPFASAFPDMGSEDLSALRLTFQRKGFLVRQERLLRDLRAAGCSPDTICALRIGDMSAHDGVAAAPPALAVSAGALERYLERRIELGLDCGPAARLIVGPDGESVSAERLESHYRNARTVRVALEANGSFCRAVLAGRSRHIDTGETHVHA
jgi:metal-sulfur cluster biosynthetic enzyme